MATVTSSFQSIAQIDSALATLNAGISLNDALAVAQAAFDRSYDWTPSAYTYTSSTQVSVRYLNGDTATVYGSGLTGDTPYMTRLDYHFLNGTNATLLGSVLEGYDGTLSGSISQVTVAKSGLGSINIYGNANVAGTGGSVTRVVWDVNGVRLEENGAMLATIWTSGGYYQATHAGTISSGTLTAGGMTLQASGFSIDANTDATTGEALLQVLLVGNDSVTGSGTQAALFGYGGADTLQGTAGNDTLDGGAGNDSLLGGAGMDTATYAGASSGVSVRLSSIASQNTGGAGSDTLNGIEYLIGSNYNDLLSGNAAANALSGGGGNDLLYGYGGSDSLNGGDGADTLNGGAGADLLTGGAGADVFLLTHAAASDTITDFASGSDKLRIKMSGIKVGDGDAMVENAASIAGPGGFARGAELVMVTADIAGAITAASASAAIGSANSAYAAGARRLFALDNGSDSALFLFTSSGADAAVSATELTRLAVLSGTAATAVGDYVFVL